MALRSLIPEMKAFPTIEERIELVLDLTRRMELLDCLLANARAKRRATDAEMSVVEMNRAEIDATWSV